MTMKYLNARVYKGSTSLHNTTYCVPIVDTTTSCGSTQPTTFLGYRQQVHTPADHAIRTRLCPQCGWTETYPLSCGDRLCPICAWRGYARNLRAMIDAFHKKGFKFAYPKFFTLTIRAGFDLNQQYKDISTAWNHVRRQKWFTKECRGGFTVVEITFGKNGWHVHLHVLADSKYINHDKFKAEWLKLTGAWNVDIRALYGSTRDVVSYTLKYMIKPPALSIEQAEEYRKTLHGKRIVRGFGSFYNITDKEDSKKFIKKCPDCGCECIVIEKTSAALVDDIKERLSELLRRKRLWKEWTGT